MIVFHILIYQTNADQDEDITELIDHICAARLEKELQGHLNETPYEDKMTKVKVRSQLNLEK